MAVASRPFSPDSKGKIRSGDRKSSLWARNLLFTRVLQVICKTTRQRNFLRLAEESQRNSSRTPAYTIGPSRRPSRVRVCPGVCDADIAIIRSHRHAQHVSRTKRYDRKLRSRTAPRANFCPGSILLSPGCRRRVSAPPPRWRGSWAPRGDHPVAAKCSDRPSTPGAAGTSADRGFRAGRRDGGVAARYRGGSAGPSAQIFARDI